MDCSLFKLLSLCGYPEQKTTQRRWFVGFEFANYGWNLQQALNVSVKPWMMVRFIYFGQFKKQYEMVSLRMKFMVGAIMAVGIAMYFIVY